MRNSKAIRLLCLFMLTLLLLCSCQKDDGAPEGMKKISDDNVAYNFYVYTQWLVDEGVKNCAYYSATDRSNVTMTSYVPDQTFDTVTQFYQSCIETYKRDFNDFQVVEETTTKMDMFDAYLVTYTFTFGEKTYKVMQAMTLHGSIMYMFTYTSSPELFESHLEEALGMLGALKFAA